MLAALEEGCELQCRALVVPRSKGGAAPALPAGDGGGEEEAAALGGAASGGAGGAGGAGAPEDAPAGDDDAVDSEGPTRKLAATSRVTWMSAAELPRYKADSRLLVPHDRNAAGLDALVWDADAGHHWPLDCTISAKHGLHAQGLADAVMQLGWSPDDGWPRPPSAEKRRMQIKYFWAVPQDVFPKWVSRQPAKRGSDTTPAAKAAYKHAKQYVLCRRSWL